MTHFPQKEPPQACVYWKGLLEHHTFTMCIPNKRVRESRSEQKAMGYFRGHSG